MKPPWRHCSCFALLHQCLQARKHHNNRWLVGLWLANVKGIMLPILKNVSFFFRDSHFVSYYIQHACTLHTQHAHSCTEVNNWVKIFLKSKFIFDTFQVFNLRQSTYSQFVSFQDSQVEFDRHGISSSRTKTLISNII